MPKVRIINGTTLHGKAVNAGDVLEITDTDFARIRGDVELFAEPVQAESEDDQEQAEDQQEENEKPEEVELPKKPKAKKTKK